MIKIILFDYGYSMLQPVLVFVSAEKIAEEFYFLFIIVTHAESHFRYFLFAFRVCWMWRGYSQWSVVISFGETVAPVVFYVHQVWLPAGWRVHGQVSYNK